MNLKYRWISHSESQTRQLGEKFCRQVGAGGIVLVGGELGSGKTCFIKGMARALGIDPDLVTSPTFALVHEYQGTPHCLFHADFYRLETAREAEELGIDDYCCDRGILVVEWGERFWFLFSPPVYQVSIRYISDEIRAIEICSPNDR